MTRETERETELSALAAMVRSMAARVGEVADRARAAERELADAQGKAGEAAGAIVKEVSALLERAGVKGNERFAIQQAAGYVSYDGAAPSVADWAKLPAILWMAYEALMGTAAASETAIVGTQREAAAVRGEVPRLEAALAALRRGE